MSSPEVPIAPATDAAAAAPGATITRRRLHQLPGDAQELLLALSWTPAALRAQLERVLGRVRGNPVRLQGSDADVLASVRHDLAQRNAISESLHRQLALRHTLAAQRLAAAKGEEGLRVAWQTRPEAETPVATLWALLTHPHGAALQDMALRDIRLGLYAQARDAQATQRDQAGLQARAQALQSEIDSLRQRLLRQQAQSEQTLQAARSALARARGETAAARREAALGLAWAARTEAAMPAAAALPAAPADLAGPGQTARACRPDKAGTGQSDWPLERGHERGLERGLERAQERQQERQAPAAQPRAEVAIVVADACLGPAPLQPSPVQGRRVLCVGGIQHAVARYRSRIENLGGRFEHHDGGIHDNAHVLEGRLARADLVICQAGCINHAAYHRIKQHCQRTGTPCLYLERASLSRFDRALQGLRPPVPRPGENPPP